MGRYVSAIKFESDLYLLANTFQWLSDKLYATEKGLPSTDTQRAYAKRIRCAYTNVWDDLRNMGTSKNLTSRFIFPNAEYANMIAKGLRLKATHDGLNTIHGGFLVLLSREIIKSPTPLDSTVDTCVRLA